MLIALIILAAIIFLIVSLVRGRSKAKNRQQNIGSKYSIALELVEGLPVQPTFATLHTCEDKLIIDVKKQSFDIPNERIIRFSNKNPMSMGAFGMKTPLFVVFYYDKNGKEQAITFTSSILDPLRLIPEFNKALNRPEAKLEAGPDGTISL
ncbi:hypothetical protein D3P09_08950 [Paenibacillus pinisoli]|uniref:Uncharacterized protein n=1 Tax=Paenibacillus pinisoli TaxID=1276110 RepID=A0A3A6PJV7_9BACL|nr:hypothetical protein [Paenibacillus pinisoli]RJX39538.1 hypothetical protein D3P09_08950 [Paenibacillus pinisoli]